jgi:hypothetical protein
MGNRDEMREELENAEKNEEEEINRTRGEEGNAKEKKNKETERKVNLVEKRKQDHGQPKGHFGQNDHGCRN